MGRPIYKHDLDDLADAETGATQLKTDFDGASDFQEQGEGSVGCPGLAGALDEFVDN